ncbi:MAG: hypothetical protein OXC68_07445 [Aestuariivita sp.]|nr:hypothetical protein [Aestuariivita sp.]
MVEIEQEVMSLKDGHNVIPFDTLACQTCEECSNPKIKLYQQVRDIENQDVSQITLW